VARRLNRGEISRFVGTVAPAKMRAICRALAIAVDCD
jgi:mRNA-degrading endonuclease toxin of MazEF toxin-antitoxin module